VAIFTRVQHNFMATTSTSATGATATLGTGVTAGNLLVATIVVGTNVTITPPSGWAQAGPTETVTSELQTQIYYLTVSSGGATSWAWSWGATAHSFGWTIDEWNSSTGWNASPVDSSAGAAETSQVTAVNCGSPAATTQASELWYGVLSWANSGQTLSGITASWTTGDSAVFTSNNTQTGFYQTVSATGTPSLAATISASEYNAGVVATFMPAAGTSTPVFPRPLIPPGRLSPAAFRLIQPPPPQPPPALTAADQTGATATGTAQQPVPFVQPNAGTAAATGTAQQPVPFVQPNAGTAAATGTAQQPVPAGVVFAGLTVGTGTAQQPVAQVTVLAGLATAAGAALQPSTTGNSEVFPASAAGTGTAQQPAVQVKPNAGLATATGTAQSPAAQVKPNAGLATATGTAQQPVVNTLSAGLAAAAGTAQSPAAKITAFAGLATATGTALQPEAPAGLAHGSGTALSPLVQVTAFAGPAHGTGSAGSPSFPVILNHWGVTFTDLGPGAVLTENDFGGTLTTPGFGAALTLPGFGGLLTTVSPSATCTIADYGATLSIAGFGAVITGGTMQQASLTLSEFNDMTIDIAVTNNGVAFNLTGYNLNLLLKSQAGVPDDTALTFSSSGGSPAITVTSPTGGLAVAQLPNADLDAETYTFYRLDVVNASSQQQTTVYGSIIWITL
jgi:hypothetical protein